MVTVLAEFIADFKALVKIVLALTKLYYANDIIALKIQLHNIGLSKFYKCLAVFNNSFINTEFVKLIESFYTIGNIYGDSFGRVY